MFGVLAYRSYRRLFIAQLFSLIATGLAGVALSLVAYQIDPQRAGLVIAGMLTIKMIAYVLFAPILQAVCSQMSRSSVLITSTLIRIVVVAVLSMAGQIWQLYLLSFVLYAAMAAYTPIFQSVIPDLVDDKDYSAALSLSRFACDMEQILSPLLAAAILIVIPAHQLFFVSAAGLCLAAGAIMSTGLGNSRPSHPNTSRLKDLGSSMAMMVKKRTLRLICLVNMVVAACGCVIMVQTVVVVNDYLKLSESYAGIFFALNAAGSMVMATIFPRLVRRYDHQSLMCFSTIALISAIFVIATGLSISEHLWACIICALGWFVMGLSWAAAEIPMGYLITRSVDDRWRSAIFAAQFSLQHLCWLVCYPLIGWLCQINLVEGVVTMAVVSLPLSIWAVISGRVESETQ